MHFAFCAAVQQQGNPSQSNDFANAHTTWCFGTERANKIAKDVPNNHTQITRAIIKGFLEKKRIYRLRQYIDFEDEDLEGVSDVVDSLNPPSEEVTWEASSHTILHAWETRGNDDLPWSWSPIVLLQRTKTFPCESLTDSDHTLLQYRVSELYKYYFPNAPKEATRVKKSIKLRTDRCLHCVVSVVFPLCFRIVVSVVFPRCFRTL
jgi:hypothetical protein